MSTITIRPARSEDFDVVGDVTARAYVDGGHIRANNESYVQALRDAADRAEKAELLVAVEGDKALGSVTIARYGTEYTDLARPGEIEFRMLAVAPEAAGRGVGRCLVRAVLDRARAEGWESVVLCSQDSMTTAQGLYRSFGFERLPERDWEPLPGLRLLAFTLELK